MKRTKRLYSIFENVNGKWIRISERAYYKENAIFCFQDRLLAPYLGTEVTRGPRMLRPVLR